MMDFSQMYAQFAIAIVLGALMGLERELAGKEAGIRTGMMVASGSAIFTIVALHLPALLAENYATNVHDILAHNAGFLNVIANIAVGIGFLGAGIIIKTEEHVYGLTSAAVIWVIAAVGMLAGLGLTQFAVTTAVTLSVLLYIMRKLGISEKLQR
jgi:putative Mg2+ transporter-C (MgtC) family protein